MEFRIASTFNDSLTKLNGQEQKAVKTTAFDLQLNPANPSLKLHKLDRAKDQNFWSIRVNRDVRIIVHKTKSNFLLCYTDHHDDAYRWAERRKIEQHPKTGAAQIVEIRERVEDVLVSRPVEVAEVQKQPVLLFNNYDDDELLTFGVPMEWISDVKKADEDSLLELIDHLPQEAAEALLEVATGGVPIVQQAPKPAMLEQPELVQAVSAPLNETAFSHPDAQRRFRVIKDRDELEIALDFPWEKWTIFLHPSQRELVEREYSGSARVSGSAGTGKTIVAIHRAAYLARVNPEARILLTTFSESLAKALQTKLKRLIGNRPMDLERITVKTLPKIAEQLHNTRFGKVTVTVPAQIKKLLSEIIANEHKQPFSEKFIFSEWNEVIDAWQLKKFDDYRDVTRLGRKTKLGVKQREILWKIFEKLNTELNKQDLVTSASVIAKITKDVRQSNSSPYDYVVVDEAQDIGVQELLLVAGLGSRYQDSMFFAGDLGQRIFQQPFSWKSLGINIQGRSHTLRVNYRTSHQIRSRADKLLPKFVSDIDGNKEDRRGTVSVFNGPQPIVELFDNEEEEINRVSKFINGCLEEGITPQEIGVFIRSTEQIVRAKEIADFIKIPTMVLTQTYEEAPDKIHITTMHLAKGLEYRAVVIMACDEDVIPNQERIETATDETDLEEIYDTERHLLYVACTRARELLLLTALAPGSEFLEDFSSKD